MKIPLPAGNFIYFGKQNKEIQLTDYSAQIEPLIPRQTEPLQYFHMQPHLGL